MEIVEEGNMQMINGTDDNQTRAQDEEIEYIHLVELNEGQLLEKHNLIKIKELPQTELDVNPQFNQD